MTQNSSKPPQQSTLRTDHRTAANDVQNFTAHQAPQEENPALTKLLKQKEKLEARIRDTKARHRYENRKKDTRRKIIIGAIAEANMALHPDSDFTRELKTLIDKNVTTPKERALLDLETVKINDRQ